MALVGTCWLLACGTGCVEMQALLQQNVAPPPPPCQVVATWCPDLVDTPDPVHFGKPVRGIAGRIYLFGAEPGIPLVGDGTLVVDLFDRTSGPKSEMPLEEWRFDPETLKRLVRTDVVGPGYTVFLPWGTYKPEIKRVQMRVCYTPAKGTPLYRQSDEMKIAAPGETGN